MLQWAWGAELGLQKLVLFLLSLMVLSLKHCPAMGWQQRLTSGPSPVVASGMLPAEEDDDPYY